MSYRAALVSITRFDNPTIRIHQKRVCTNKQAGVDQHERGGSVAALCITPSTCFPMLFFRIIRYASSRTLAVQLVLSVLKVLKVG